MPRHMSFALTTPQFLDGSKTVTRRMGWLKAKTGDVVIAVEKAQGLKKGEKVKVLDAIELVDVRSEPLRRMLDDLTYGAVEVRREGFPKLTPAQFAAFFCKTHKGCTLDEPIRRIEYKRLNVAKMHANMIKSLRKMKPPPIPERQP